MIATLTGNPSIDYLVYVDSFKEGALNRTTKEEILPGGKGINVAWMLKNLGIDCMAYGFQAGSSGQMLDQLLCERSLPHDLIKVDKGFTRINVKLKSGGESEINGRGPIVSSTALKELEKKLSFLSTGDYLVLSGSLPRNASSRLYADIISRLSPEVRVVVDTEGDALSACLPLKPFLIKPNKAELSSYFKCTLPSGLKGEIEMVALAHKLQDEGAQNVLISLGGDGAILLDSLGIVHIAHAVHGAIMNSVGAGDAMVAGFLYGYLSSHSYWKALSYAVAAGSASAFSGHIATREEVCALERRSEIWG